MILARNSGSKRNKQTKKKKPETIYEKRFNNPHLKESIDNAFGLPDGQTSSNLAMYDGNWWFNHYYDWLLEIALQLFEYEGLPKEIPFYELEANLIYDGLTALYYDKELHKYVILKGTYQDINLYNEPIRFQPANIRYKNKPFNLYVEAKELRDCGVLFRNNLTYKPLTTVLRNYASELAKVKQIIDLNLNAHKHPIMLESNDYNLLSLQKAFDKFEQNAPVIVSKESAVDGQQSMKDRISAINLGIPYIIDKLQTYHKQIFDEAMNRIGLNSVNDQKKERMIVDEANANQDKFLATQNNLLMFREQGCERANEYYGLNLSVKPRKFRTMTEYGEYNNIDLYNKSNFSEVENNEF